MRRALFSTLLLGILAVTASASTIHVPGDYPSILEAVDASAQGDSILVGPGDWTHEDTRIIIFPGGPVAVTANAFLKGGISVIGEAGADSTWVRTTTAGSMRTCFFIKDDNSGDVVIEGFTVRSMGNGFSAYMSSRHVVHGCRVENCGATGISLNWTDLILEDSEIMFCGTGPTNAGVDVTSGDVEVRRCRFEGNEGGGLRSSGSGGYCSAVITDCEFVANRHIRGGGVNLGEHLDLLVENCLFLQNVAEAGSGGGLKLEGVEGTGTIRNNVFAFDSCGAPGSGGGLNVGGYNGEIVGNTFWGCHCDPAYPGATFAGSARQGWPPSEVIFERNVVAGSTGGYTTYINGYLGDHQVGCNDYWDNEGGYNPQYCWPLGTTDFSADPQFCCPESLDFHVATSSPCLPENSSGICGQVGVYGSGCASWGTVVIALNTRPAPLSIAVDDSAYTTLALFNWYADSTHIVTVPGEALGEVGTRYDFSHWEDGPVDTVRTIVVPPTPTLYTAIYDTLHTLTMQADSGGSVLPASDFYPRGSEVQITAIPDSGSLFTDWEGAGNGSYTGSDSVAMVTMSEPLTQTAYFTPIPPIKYELRMVADSGGVVMPESGLHEIWTEVEIAATPYPYYVFTEWIGNGDGSYSGKDNPATVTMNGPITQGALFQRISHEVTMSLSDTDPGVSTGPPIGFGLVYLWLACSTEGGLKGFEGDVSGTMEVYSFGPAPGIINGGDATHLELVSPDCLVGPVLLGWFLVQDDGGGSLCLVPSASHGFLGGRDCSNPTMLIYEWPADMRITGVATDGSAPCDSGRACDEDATVDPVGVLPPPQLEQTSYDTALEWSGPNPFRDRTTFQFTLACQGRVRLSIYDVRGRLVRELLDDDLGIGRHTFSWDGRDRAGDVIPSGVYFARLKAGDFAEIRKLVRVSGH